MQRVVSYYVSTLFLGFLQHFTIQSIGSLDFMSNRCNSVSEIV